MSLMAGWSVFDCRRANLSRCNITLVLEAAKGLR